MKKILSMALVIAMSLTLATSALAAEANSVTATDYAYMNARTASPEMKARILEARFEIIYGFDQAWSIDGTAMVVNEDGTFEYLPKFSDLYPGWDLAEICALNQTTQFATTSAAAATAGNILFEGNVNIIITTSATPFYRFTANGGTVEVIADTIPGNKYSAAIRNEDTGVDDAYKGNMLLGQSVKLVTKNLVRYACRASSPDAAGDAYMIVQYI